MTGAASRGGDDQPNFETAVVRETARAKINLSLKIPGRRADGYHAVESLVAFADIGDAVVLVPDQPTGVTVTGPFARGITGDNLVATALERLASADPELRLGHVTIEKRLPVAAGLGGGSANAAACLRAVRTLNPARTGHVDWQGLAVSLGADVPVCLFNASAWMTGIGERLTPLPALPHLDAVLVNPILPVPGDKTAQVFRALRAQPTNDQGDAAPPVIGDTEELLGHMRAVGNDLTRAACAVVAGIEVVLGALRSLDGCVHAALSGAGPTCFAVFGKSDIQKAVGSLRAQHSDWWIEPVILGDDAWRSRPDP